MAFRELPTFFLSKTRKKFTLGLKILLTVQKDQETLRYSVKVSVKFYSNLMNWLLVSIPHVIVLQIGNHFCWPIKSSSFHYKAPQPIWHYYMKHTKCSFLHCFLIEVGQKLKNFFESNLQKLFNRWSQWLKINRLPTIFYMIDTKLAMILGKKIGCYQWHYFSIVHVVFKMFYYIKLFLG